MVEIERTGIHARHPWPDGTFLQGGQRGLVIVRGTGGSYTTAFVEAFHDDFSFLRGEGATVKEAEDAAWAKAARFLACPGHEYEPRGYKNGAGFCRNCGRFKSHAFTPAELGMFCARCDVPANHHWGGYGDVELAFCEAHVPHEDSWHCSCGGGSCKGTREAVSPEDVGAASMEMLEDLARGPG